MKYLITGGCGFLGSNLACEVLKRGDELFVLDNLSRTGSQLNLEWLKTQGKFTFFQNDIRNYADVEKIIREVKPTRVFHLAGQVAMTTSISNPRLDLEINVIGSHNVLEAVRTHSPESAIIYSSTNKVYGDLDTVRFEEGVTRYNAPDFPKGFDESVPLDFRSPYGCSKGAADQYMLDYSRVYGLKTVVFRHSSIYGGRQFSTYDQGWIGWFVLKACEAHQGKTEPFTISGNGKQVRDILYASDLVSCYFLASEKLERAQGQAFNIGGGVGNSLSLLELLSLLEKMVDTKLKFTKLPPRESDQKVFVANISKAKDAFGWEPRVSREEGLRQMITWVQESAK
jgi:CDP-paratose 2-epimerase